ncbi:hypothetical protein R9C00_24330 [Flammeovirgaceae bacterium SG7u.111]|nr:hypothetical protein [Flammeovirgaceae bacterium SG7u.132]WPO34830.1 hypothetical protein R9C00_24330 [Flammeovirgaceae bacterium SG7u.111]
MPRFFISIPLILTGVFSWTEVYSQERILEAFDFEGDSLRLIINKIDYEEKIVTSEIENRLWEEDSIDVVIEAEIEEGDGSVYNKNGIQIEEFQNAYLVEDDSLLQLYQTQMIGERSFDIHLCGLNYEIHLIKGRKVVEMLSIILNCGRVSTSRGEFDMDMLDLSYLVGESIFRKNQVKVYAISYESEEKKVFFTQAVENTNSIIFTDKSKTHFIDIDNEIEVLLGLMR